MARLILQNLRFRFRYHQRHQYGIKLVAAIPLTNLWSLANYRRLTTPGYKQAISKLIRLDASKAPRNGASVGMLSGKLAASAPAVKLPWLTQPGSTAPSNPARPPATAASGDIRRHNPSSTGTTIAAHSKSAIRNSRSTEKP